VLPGVEAAGAITPLPVSGGGWQTGFYVEGRPEPQPGQMPSTDIARINSEYFRVMNIPLLRGRYFTEQDVTGSPDVAIVDETFVRAYWPNEDPIGKRIKLGGPQSNNPWLTIVGVVPHVKNYGVDADSRVETYLPYMQSSVLPLNLVLRTGIEPSNVASVVRAAVREIDRDLPIYNIRTMEQYVSDQTAPRRLATILLGVFALVALVLAAIGIYGVMAYSVTQRTHEIGIRMALGAERRDVLKLVVRQGMTLTLVGVGIGLGGAFGLTRLMASILFGVSATDLMTFATIPVVLVIVAVVACYVPARRATKVDPIIALRYE
jgi:putative ABC transport system permease protein